MPQRDLYTGRGFVYASPAFVKAHGLQADRGSCRGRGAYVCKSADCLRAARKARRLERAFSCQIPAEVYDRMEEEIGK